MNYGRIFLYAIIGLITFVLYKAVFVGMFKLINKGRKTHEKTMMKFDAGISVAMMLVFMISWCVAIGTAIRDGKMTILEYYILFCVIGVVTTIWCYFSWDAEHIWIKPHISSDRQIRLKKIVWYLLILVFTVCHGYHQTSHLMNPEYVIPIEFSMTNYTIVVIAIAVDRIMNPIIAGWREKTAKIRVC